MEVISHTLSAFFEKVAQYLPNLFMALVILVLGWLLAKVLSVLVRQVILTGDLDLRLARRLDIEPIMGDLQKPRKQLATGIELLVYYFLLLVTLVFFLQSLGDTQISDMLASMLEKPVESFPKILYAVLILGTAWFIGLVLKYAAIRGLKSFQLGEKLGRYIEGPEGAAKPKGKGIAESIGDFLFYLVLLFSLPALLEVFELTSVSKPFQEMFTKAMTFVPNLLMAALILVVGYLFARLCERLVVNLAAAVGVNRYTDEMKEESILKSLDLARILGTLAFLVVMVPVLEATFETLKMLLIAQVFIGMMNKVTLAIPLILGAFVLVVLGLVVGRYLGDLTSQVLRNVGFDVLLGRLGLGRLEGAANGEGDKRFFLSKVAGNVVNAVIVLFLAMEAFKLMNLSLIAAAIEKLLLFLPNVLVAFVILGLGFYLAGVVQEMVKRGFTANGKTIEADTVALVLRYAVIVFAFFMAFDQLGVAHAIVVNAFIIILGTAGLAVALAFGLGARDQASEYLKGLLNKKEGGEKAKK